MIEPLIWMFKTEKFKNHFLYFIIISIVCWGISFGLITFSQSPELPYYLIVNRILIILGIILMILPFLCLSGYFWCLTENVIDRHQEAKVNSVYNGKAKFKEIITLPQLDFRRFVWRGIAGIVATIIMELPIILFFCLSSFSLANIVAFWSINPLVAEIIVILAIFLIMSIIPALLWNYARRDSIVATLNLPKAIYIIGTYTGKYIANTFLYILYSLAYGFILYFILGSFGLAIPQAGNFGQISDFNILTNQIYVIYFIVNYLMGIYFIYVYAYLLGTIAPPSEY